MSKNCSGKKHLYKRKMKNAKSPKAPAPGTIASAAPYAARKVPGGRMDRKKSVGVESTKAPTDQLNAFGSTTELVATAGPSGPTCGQTRNPDHSGSMPLHLQEQVLLLHRPDDHLCLITKDEDPSLSPESSSQ